MNLKEAIKIHNELCSKEEIKKYCEALHIVCEKMQNCKPKKEYYKSSIINDYYIEHPYMELTISNGKAVYRRHKYSCSSESKDKKIRSNYCLSICRCNRGLEKVKEVEILQMIICGDKEVIAEVILKEDFEKYFEGSK